MTRRPLLLAGLLTLLPACGHKGNPLPPLRRLPPPPLVFRLAQRGDVIELQARAPAASVDGVAYDDIALEFVYGSGERDLERTGTRLLVRSEGGDLVTKTLALPAPGTLLRATVRAVAAGQKSPRSLTKALVAQEPLEAPHGLLAKLLEDGVALAWQGVVPKEVPPPPLPVRPGFPPSDRLGTPGAVTGTKPTPPGGTATPSAAPATPAAAPANPAAATPAAPGTPAAGTPAAGAAPAQSAPSPSAASPTGEKAKPAATSTASGTSGAAKAEETKATRRNGFFVYRRSGDAVYGGPLGSEPLERPEYKDTTAPLGVRTCYVVRGVGSSDPLIESDPSNEACVVRRDITPPTAPAGIAIMKRAGGLEVIWSPSGEQDLAGYRVYRAGAGGQPTKLAELLPSQTSYLDASAQQGVPYSYTVTAFDQAGNQSAQSEAVEAALP